MNKSGNQNSKSEILDELLKDEEKKIKSINQITMGIIYNYSLRSDRRFYIRKHNHR